MKDDITIKLEIFRRIKHEKVQIFDLYEYGIGSGCPFLGN